MIPPEKREQAYSKRRETLLQKYGGADGLRRHYQLMQQKSMLHPNKQKGRMHGGFSDKEFARQASRLGVEARKAKREERNAE